jgi:hypothetical protein
MSNTITRYQGEPIGFRITGSIEAGMTLSAKIKRTTATASIVCTVTAVQGGWDVVVPGGELLPAADYVVSVIVKQSAVTVSVESFNVLIAPQP